MIGRKQRRKPAAGPVRFECHEVGHALVVGPSGSRRQPVLDWARVLPAGPGHTVVVLDLPFPASPWTWPAVADALRGRGAIRLAGSNTGAGPAATARWLAEELGVEVVAPDGAVRPVGTGTFVDARGGAGCWRGFARGQDPVSLGQRFPQPPWENALLSIGNLGVVLGGRLVAEQIPAGLWLHGSPDLAAKHARPVHGLPCRPDSVALVVGVPDGPAVRPEEIARLVSVLPADLRAVLRFAPFGAEPDQGTLGQLVADALAQPVVCYTGLPVAAPDASERLEVVAVDEEGRPSWRPFATHLGHVPGGQPVVLGRRAPFDDGAAPVHRVANDVVVEVIQSGLWVRYDAEPACAARVRATQLDPRWIKLAIGDPEQPASQRLSLAAAELFERLDSADRRLVRFMYSLPGTRAPEDGRTSRAVSNVPATGAAALQEETPTRSLWATPERTDVIPVAPIAVESSSARKEPKPAEPATAAELPRPNRIQDRLAPAARPPVEDVEPPEPAEPLPVLEVAEAAEPEREPPGFVAETVEAGRRSTTAEREWMRKTLGADYDTFANGVVRLLSAQPGLRAVEGDPLEAVVTDFVGVQVYVSTSENKVDEALRSGRLGALRPFACCVVSGLQRLPSHRGPALHAASALPEAGPEAGTIVAERRFVNSVSSTSAALPGAVEYLVWSTTGRRVGDIDPARDRLDRVVFMPGSRFKVLAVRDGDISRVFLREIVEPDAVDALDARDRTILARLEKVAAARDAATRAAPELTAEDHPWILDGLGLTRAAVPGLIGAQPAVG